MSARIEDRRAVRGTAGLNPAEYLATPLAELLDKQASYADLLARLHPEGLRCPCGSEERVGHGRSRTGYPMYKCRVCSTTYSIKSGTVFAGCHLEAHKLLLFMRLVAEGLSAADIAPAVGLHRNSVAQLMSKVAIYSRYRGH